MCDGKGKCGKASVEDTVDRISRLPDVLLNHILSFNSTKTSVSTSVLSKRWRCLWASVSSLVLSNSDFLPRGEDLSNRMRRRANFLAFVEQFLMRNRPCYIRKLHLYVTAGNVPLEISHVSLICSHIAPLSENNPQFMGEFFLNELDSPSDLELWISVAKEYRVRNLKVSYPGEVLEFPHFQQPHQLPPCLFTCDSLVVLKLRHMFLNLPIASSSLPNLRVLILEDIVFKDDVSASNLINSSCPVLEKLVIRRLEEGDNLRNLVVNAPTLKLLCVEFVSAYDSSTTISTTKIDVPGLEYLELQDGITMEYVAGNLGSLVEAYLDISIWDARSLFKLLKSMCNVQKLTLSDSTLVSLEQADSFNLPTFRKLTFLEITEEGDHLVSWELVVEVLKCSPILEDLFLEGIIFEPRREFNWTAEQYVPSCLTSYLKTVDICLSLRGEDELEIVQYFIKHSRALEEMTIFIGKHFPEKNQTKNEIIAFPRGSPVCKINFDETSWRIGE